MSGNPLTLTDVLSRAILTSSLKGQRIERPILSGWIMGHLTRIANGAISQAGGRLSYHHFFRLRFVTWLQGRAPISASRILQSTGIEDCRFLLRQHNLLDESTSTLIHGLSNQGTLVADTLVQLDIAGLLTGENRNLVLENANHPQFEYFVNGLHLLNGANLLTQNNFHTLIKEAQNARQLCEVVIFLHKSRLLNEENFNSVTQTTLRNINLEPPLRILGESDLLNQTNLNFLINEAASSGDLTRSIQALRNHNLLNQDNLNALFRNMQHIRPIADGLNVLERSGHLTQESLLILLRNPEYALNIASGLLSLFSNNLFEANHIEVILEMPENAYDVARIIHITQQSMIHESEIRTILHANRGSITAFSRALQIVWQRKLLSQESFDQLIQRIQDIELINEGLQWLHLSGHLNASLFRSLVQNHHTHPRLYWILQTLNDQQLLNTQIIESILILEEEHINLLSNLLLKLKERNEIKPNLLTKFLKNPQQALLYFITNEKK